MISKTTKYGLSIGYMDIHSILRSRLNPLNPIPLGGGGIYALPTTFRQFSLDVLIRAGSNYTLNSRFVITEHLKLVSGQKIFPTTRERPPKAAG